VIAPRLPSWLGCPVIIVVRRHGGENTLCIRVEYITRIQNEKKYAVAVADGELLVEQLTSSLDSIEGLATVTSTVTTAPTAVGAVVKEEQGQIDNDDDDAGTVVVAAAATSTAMLQRPVAVVVAAVAETASSSSSLLTSSASSSIPLETTKTGFAARMERLTRQETDSILVQ
jgi:hypothetical protein